MSPATRWPHRALHVIDVENLACSPLPTAGEVRKLMVRYAQLVGIGSTDQVVIACNHKALLTVACGWPGARYRVRSGPDGADLELIDVLERERAAERFGRIVIASGDGRFAESAARLAVAGCRVTVVSRRGSLAVRLRLAANDVICLDGPAPWRGSSRLWATVNLSTAARPALAPARTARPASLHQTPGDDSVRSTDMTELGGFPEPLPDARSLPELLDAAYAAFEAMLDVIRLHDQADEGYFVPMVMAGASAASGRDYLLLAPSLPPRQLASEPTGRDQWRQGDSALAARWLTWLCRHLDARLSAAGTSACLIGDRDACLGAAKCARAIAALMGGGPP